MAHRLVGARLGGRYDVESLLGVGGMGAVYLARDAVGQRVVALKVIRHELLQNSELLPRLRREARAASRIDNPHITRILDFSLDGQAFLVMERIEGPTLAAVLADEGHLPVPRALAILGQLAEGLAAAHACRVIHRDLKPGNVVLTRRQGEEDFVKILDFGLAKIVDPTGSSVLTPTGEAFGTAEYISPEQACDLKLDHRADIYSLGVVAFEMLTGQVPFTGDMVDVVAAHAHAPPPAMAELAPEGQDISPALEALVARCLAKQPAERYDSAAELLRAIRALPG